jgi:hypothetical protein
MAGKRNLYGDALDREVRNVLDAEDRLQRADMRKTERLRLLPAGRRVAAPGTVRAVHNPERSEFVDGDHGQMRGHSFENGTALFVTEQQLNSWADGNVSSGTGGTRQPGIPRDP